MDQAAIKISTNEARERLAECEQASGIERNA